MVPCVEELLAGVGSLSVAATEAVLEIEPPAEGAVTTIWMLGAAPTARAGLVQVTVPEAWLQVQPVPEEETYEVPAGRASVTCRFEAALGPALETASV